MAMSICTGILTDKSNSRTAIMDDRSAGEVMSQENKVSAYLHPETCHELPFENKSKGNTGGIKDQVAHKRQRIKSIDNFDTTSFKINLKSRRLVTKEGFVDINYVNMPGAHNRYLNYLKDIFHTLMDARWRYIGLLFTLSFLISWLLFGTLWYMIVQFNKKERNCIDNVDSWVSAFLFSVETQTTIGYGGRAVTPECPEGVVILLVQTIIGMFINSIMLGLLFAKIARPKNRGKSIIFSENAVITLRDGNFCLIFKYTDMCRKLLLDSNLRLNIIRPRLTEEGEYIPLDMADLQLTLDYQQIDYTLRVFPLFPVTVIHVIDDESPLYNMTKFKMEADDFELIVILEGTVPTTGNTTQVITSYMSNEILWGHRFKPISVRIHNGQEINSIDLSTLNDTYEDGMTPHCSAEEFLDKEESESDKSVSQSCGYESGAPSSLTIGQPSSDFPDSSPKPEIVTSIDITVDSMDDFPELKESEA